MTTAADNDEIIFYRKNASETQTNFHAWVIGRVIKDYKVKLQEGLNQPRGTPGHRDFWEDWFEKDRTTLQVIPAGLLHPNAEMYWTEFQGHLQRIRVRPRRHGLTRYRFANSTP